MKKQKFSKTKQCLFAIAEYLQEHGDLWVNCMIGITHPFYRRTFIGGGSNAVRRRRRHEAEREYRKHIALLKRQQWIQMRRIGDSIQIALTPKGKAILLKEQMKVAPPCSNNVCTLVIFDVPERERCTRQQFRAFLKECDFKQLQRSVWMSKRDVVAPLREFIEHTKSGAWIRAFCATDVDTVRK